ncbi:UNVERIFIED_CONTAM: hypothetical protein GTU68_057712 [Idotea baltica]|nr:hypothetical protein [Idotea baltica]
MHFKTSGDVVLAKVAAGVSWDEFVEAAVERDLAGVTCLSGIPGSVGATPIQNVGAYGQEVSDTIVSVGVMHRESGKISSIAGEDCGFAYRHSRFKERPNEFVVIDVTFALKPGAKPTIRYGELKRRLESLDGPNTLGHVREQVLLLRRGKSMVIDPSDENHRSAGSFFTNPIVPVAVAEEVLRRAANEGTIKLAAGWLIEKSGINKGMREGNVGISSKHALALVHHGGGTTRELLAFAEKIADHVEDVFGVKLEREPQFVGR